MKMIDTASDQPVAAAPPAQMTESAESTAPTHAAEPTEVTAPDSALATTPALDDTDGTAPTPTTSTSTSTATVRTESAPTESASTTTTAAATAAVKTPASAETSSPCATEIDAYCQREADLLTIVQASSVVDNNTVQHIHVRLRDCLVAQAESLTPVCVHALATGLLLQKTPSDSDVATGDTLVVPSATTIMPVPASENAPSVSADQNGDDSEVEIRVIIASHHTHGGAAPTAPGSFVRIGPSPAQYASNARDDAAISELFQPLWLWLGALPFLCVGIYVAVTHTLTYVRRRRDIIYRVSASQSGYSTIPTTTTK